MIAPTCVAAAAAASSMRLHMRGSCTTTTTTTTTGPTASVALTASAAAKSIHTSCSSSYAAATAAEASDDGSTSPTMQTVPEFFHHADSALLIHLIADMLNRLTRHNDLIPLTQSGLTRFHSRAAPNISVDDYLARIVKYAAVEKVCLVVLLIYVDRNPTFTISSLTVHRFIITAITIACKV
ncbi:hypothetical protein HDU67_001750 [Dinochytrium kinnereticum]|nr:hypothetical protein HDU67_001750 [Dinochytrium kinnereticum]